MMVYAGVDGCKGGWCVVLWDNGEMTSSIFCTSFKEVFQVTRDCIVVAVDMPIGLPRRGQPRECDRQARQRLGKQASSIFPAPPREALSAQRFEELKGWGLSLQAFHLFPKIREIEGIITPQLQQRVREAHPELAYRTRSQEPLARKKTALGQQQRAALLPFQPEPLKVGRDDLLDAAILAVVARDLHLDRAGRCGGLERDERGLVMEICF